MATNTYVALATQTLGSNAATVTFSSIPQGYTDLVVVFNGSNSAGLNKYIQFNGDTGSNYSCTALSGDGSSASSSRFSQSYIDVLGASTNRSVILLQVQNYSNTTTFKTYLSRPNTAAVGTEAIVGLWRNTAAITQIDFKVTANSYAAGSTFSLYGIASASVGAKATGGIISSDSTYWYHTFLSTGTFTPLQSLSADILSVAGGGGGGAFSGGGGGAGGLLAFSGQSLTATGYTVTVGSGGAAGTGSGAGSSGTNTQFGALTACVGGGAGAGRAGGNGASGGSGGGNANRNGTTYSGTAGQGYAGGGGSGYGGHGGGGAGGVGQNNGDYAGAGGVGATSTFINQLGAALNIGQLVSSNYYIAGGGGGRDDYNTSAAGGYGGGGTGNGTAGTVNTGGGGGSASGTGGAGGSGIVIVRYAK